MTGWLILACFALALASLIVWRIVVGRRKPGYLLSSEYWVYISADALPEQEALMTRMISESPHHRRGQAPIGAREGMLFTDLRLHVALATRSKNPHAFRPDLFDRHVEPTQERLEQLAESQALVKVRYVSESPVKDLRHLQFLPHMADAVSDLAGGKAVFDLGLEQLWTAEEFRERLSASPNCERPDFHVRTVWEMQPDGLHVLTFGLRKCGRPEWIAGPFEADQKTLVLGLVMRAAFQAFRRPDEAGPWEYEEYGDTFVLELLDEFAGGRQKLDLRRRMGE